MAKVPAACQTCGAADDLTAINRDESPLEMDRVDIFCADIFACYERAEREEI